MLAQVPIYGTRDAGRGFWKRLRTVLTETAKLKENHILAACYTYTNESGRLMAIVVTHVDDLFYVLEYEVEWIMDEVRKVLNFGSEEVQQFRFCGREIVQDDSFSIRVTCRDTTLKIKSIPISAQRAKQGPQPTTGEEKEQFMSVTGSLNWVARCARVDLSYRVSELQQHNKDTTVADLKSANKVLAYAKLHPDRGLVFEAGAIDWDDLAVGSIGDASHGQELEEETGEPFRSQGAKLTILAPTDLATTELTKFHLVAHSSTTLRRVVRATVQAETYQLQLNVEAGDIIRAAIADMMGRLDHKHWERTAGEFCQHIWFTDCWSTVSALLRPVLGKITDKRLGIEMAALRQSLWRRKGQALGDPRVSDAVPALHDATDIIRWVDTDVMIADPLTKTMDPEKLATALENNLWDLKQPIESIAKKRQKQAQRRSKKDAESSAEPGSEAQTVAPLAFRASVVSRSHSVSPIRFRSANRPRSCSASPAAKVSQREPGPT